MHFFVSTWCFEGNLLFSIHWKLLERSSYKMYQKSIRKSVYSTCSLCVTELNQTEVVIQQKSFHLMHYICLWQWDFSVIKSIVVPSHSVSKYGQTTNKNRATVESEIWNILQKSYRPLLWYFLVLSEAQVSGNHFLSQYWKEQHEHYSKFLLLCSTEETKILKQSEKHGAEHIMTDFYFLNSELWL